jgi:aspartyl-tRNA(Asn)/glutamyl-tRNA(Gln) amidotransferase subunit A
MATELHRQTVARLAELIATRKVSPREVLETFLARIEKHNPALNALVTLCPDQARREADVLTRELEHGQSRGPLHGIPIAVKDLSDTVGLRTTYGSILYKDHVPDADAFPVARLRAAGAVIVGKSNTHEFACGTSTNNPHYGATHNPWRHGHVPGGSSGGSGAAVAAGLVPLATGSDTGGSIRIPSAACGCVGIKPTHGRVSLRGTHPMASSLDHVGALARTARDCAIALNTMAGFDVDDPWSRRFPQEDFTRELGASLSGRKIGIAPGYRPIGIEPAVQENLERAVVALRDMHVEIVEVELPSASRVSAAFGPLVMGETFAVHDWQYAQHRDRYGRDVQLQLDFGATVPMAQLVRAQYAREDIARALERLVTERVDALLMPTLAIEAPPIGRESLAMDGDTISTMIALASYTFLHNLVRLPTVAVPTGRGATGLPTSVQITTASGAEALALGFAHQLEEAVWPEQERWPEL